MNTEKARKEDVSYSTGHVHSHCGPTYIKDRNYCRHFIPRTTPLGECEKVEGKISRTYWCELFSRISSS